LQADAPAGLPWRGAVWYQRDFFFGASKSAIDPSAIVNVSDPITLGMSVNHRGQRLNVICLRLFLVVC
jgi:hypothetical protein